jgi:cation transport regulator ChaC
MKYFAYGSNMDPVRMQTRGASFTSRRHAVLKGYSLQFNKLATSSRAKPGEGKGNIVVADDFVEGALYEIATSGRDNLDKYEGYSTEYDRINVLVQLDDGTKVEAFTYVAKPNKVKNGLKPTKEYLSHYLAGKDILSKEYRKLESWPTID